MTHAIPFAIILSTLSHWGTGRVSGKAPLVLVALYRRAFNPKEGVKSSLKVPVRFAGASAALPIDFNSRGSLGAVYTPLPHRP